MDTSRKFHLCIAYDWEYDRDFIGIIENIARTANLSTYIVDSMNLSTTIDAFRKKELDFRYFFDRASDTSNAFVELNRLIQKANIPHLDPFDSQDWAKDKATMHLEFISRGINTPYSIIIPPYNDKKEIYISVSDLAKLGRPFIIKPANTSGGGIGVVSGAETLQDVLLARKEFEHDKYLLQEYIRPLEIGGKPCWFRGYYSCGLLQCTWWNPFTHIYSLLTEDEIGTYGIGPIFPVIGKIAEICKLRFFSTEIALTEQWKFVVVDYVNNASDMRLQSVHHDGVPDTIVSNIAEKIVTYICGIVGV